ncbi:cytochrome bd oxidase small subunit CydS [Solibacillus sp. FSL W8-0474]
MMDFIIFYAPFIVVFLSVLAAFVVAVKTETH